jgi:hypothetical protein
MRMDAYSHIEDSILVINESELDDAIVGGSVERCEALVKNMVDVADIIYELFDTIKFAMDGARGRFFDYVKDNRLFGDLELMKVYLRKLIRSYAYWMDAVFQLICGDSLRDASSVARSYHELFTPGHMSTRAIEAVYQQCLTFSHQSGNKNYDHLASTLDMSTEKSVSMVDRNDSDELKKARRLLKKANRRGRTSNSSIQSSVNSSLTSSTTQASQSSISLVNDRICCYNCTERGCKKKSNCPFSHEMPAKDSDAHKIVTAWFKVNKNQVPSKQFINIGI